MRVCNSVIAALLLCASSAALAQGSRPSSSYDYALKCSGCHRLDGSGKPDSGIPDFRDQVGYFLMLPEGRAFLMQVAGLLSSGLNDERSAAVTNYIVETFSGVSMPADFEPYTAEEAQHYRETRPADIAQRRYDLYVQLIAAGYKLK